MATDLVELDGAQRLIGTVVLQGRLETLCSRSHECAFCSQEAPAMSPLVACFDRMGGRFALRRALTN